MKLLAVFLLYKLKAKLIAKFIDLNKTYTESHGINNQEKNSSF